MGAWLFTKPLYYLATPSPQGCCDPVTKIWSIKHRQKSHSNFLESPLKGGLCMCFAFCPFLLVPPSFLLTTMWVHWWQALWDYGMTLRMETTYYRTIRQKEPECGNLGIKDDLPASCSSRLLHDKEIASILILLLWLKADTNADWNTRWPSKSWAYYQSSFHLLKL